MSWIFEVVADPSGRWYGNDLRFATMEEARNYAADLKERWRGARNTRVVESDDAPVTHTYRNRQLRPSKSQ
jgi:hypothetical protein